MDQDDQSKPPPSYDEVIKATSQPNTNQKLHLNEEIPNNEKPPSTAPTIPSGPLTFKITTHKPLLSTQTLNITPTQPFGPVSAWKMRFRNRGSNATLSRHALPPQDRLPLRDIAEITYPGALHGIIIKFKPCEAEIEARGLRHVSDTDRMMLVEGYLTTKYSLDLPVMLKTVAWKVVEAGQVSGKACSWTPFSTQSLIEEGSGKVWATFSHSAPFAKETGTLVIPQTSRTLPPGVVEAIIVACAAMVGFQEKAGLTSLLIESGYEALGKNKRPA